MSEKKVVARIVIDYLNEVTESVESYEIGLYSPITDLEYFTECLTIFTQKYLDQQEEEMVKEITQLSKKP